jgi:LuxR family maltose regulon positive regulatory protein
VSKQVALSDPLVSTKLRPPVARPKLVSRSRLTEKLERESGRKLTLISAPAGFGKTTLLVEWSKNGTAGGRLGGWVSLDEDDNDPVRFLSYLVTTLGAVEEGIGEGILAALRSPESPKIEALTATLLNEMAALPGELDLVLDNYHLIDSESVHRIVSFMLERPTAH